MKRTQKRNDRNEELRYVPVNAGYPYQALKLVQAQLNCTLEQMALITRNYFQDDIDEF